MCQFDHKQHFHSYEGASHFRLEVEPGTESDLGRVYDCWTFSVFTSLDPGETLEYRAWWSAEYDPMEEDNQSEEDGDFISCLKQSQMQHFL